MERLLGLSELYLTASTPEERVELTDELAQEVAERVHRLGHSDLHAWVSTENFEMRADAGGAWLDRQVLDILRERSSASSDRPFGDTER